ncbi:MAG: ubiquinol-cytochrome c reductase iron-sulfur subunit [Bryobacterales bacterium]|nr:ubiquinol-cytochrome c reductase iron-sulfur subunit [Bryobacterales bacterium]
MNERRNFLIAVIYGLWSLIALALAVPAAIYLLLPPRARKRQEWVDAAGLGELETGVPREVVFRRSRQDGWKVVSEKSVAWVVKLGGNRVVAYAPQCTHLGCAYHWDDTRDVFLCPCHSSTFSLDGRVLSGPAPRALDRYELRLEKDRLLLGAVRRSGEPS